MSDPLSIAEELLESGDVQGQKNALTFLRVLADEKSIPRLVRAAVESSDAAIRAWAADELDELDAAGKRLATDALNARFETGPRGKEWGRAYFLLARLGQPAKLRGLLSRLRCANWIHALAYPSKGVAFYGRNSWPCILGSATGAFALLLYMVLLTSLPTQVTTLVLASALLLAVPAGILVAYRATAFHHYAEALPGVIVECVWAASGVFVLGLVGVAVFYVLQIQSTAETFYFVVALAVAVGLVRAATILAFGAAAGIWGSLIQVAAGAAVGTIVFTAFALFDLGSLSSDYWPTTVALAFGVATTFAFVDRDGAGKVRLASYSRRVAVASVIVAFLGVAAWAGVRVKAADEEALDVSRSFAQLPTVLSFWLPEQQTIAFGIQQQGDTAVDVYVRDSAGTEIVAPRFDLAEPQSEFEEPLKPAIYTVEISGFAQYNGYTPTPQSIVLPMLTGQRIVVESIGGANPVEVDPVPFHLMTVSQRDIEVPALTEAATGALPGAATDIEIQRVPFFHEFQVPENLDRQVLRVRLNDESGFTGSFSMLLEGNGMTLADGQIVSDLLFLPPGNYRLIVYDDSLHEGAFGEAAKGERPRTVRERPILPGLHLTVEQIGAGGDLNETLAIAASAEAAVSGHAVSSMPAVRWLEVTGSSLLSVHAELVSPPYDHDFRLKLYDEAGVPAAAPDASDFDFGWSLDGSLPPGRYILLVDANSPATSRGTGLRLGSVSTPETMIQFRAAEAKVYRPADGTTVLSSSEASRSIDVPVVPFVHFISVPSGGHFTLEAGVSQRVEAPDVDGYTDYVLTLYGSSGEIAFGDDPARLETILGEGNYWLAVEVFGATDGRAAKRSSDGSISLPAFPATEGVELNLDVATAAAP